MLPFLDRAVRQPVRLAPLRPRRPASRSTRPATSSPTCSAAGRVRSCSPAAAPRPTTRPSSARSIARGGMAVCPAVEHHAVLHAVEHVHGRVVGVDAAGPRRSRRSSPTRSTARTVSVVSVMAVNNEVGTITDLAAVAAVVRRAAPQAVLHTDAVQAACWLDLRTITPHVDLLSLSAHKFGGPKGVGVLVARGGVGVRAAADRRRPGARAAQRHPQRRRHRRAWPRRCGSPTPSAPTRTCGSPRCATRSSTVCRPSSTACTRPSTGRRQGGRVGARVHRGHRERGAAVPARRGGRVRQRGVGVRQRGDGAVARAGGDGCARRAALGCAAADARSHHDRRRRRPGDDVPSSTPVAPPAQRATPREGARGPQRRGRLVGRRGRLLDDGHDVVGVTMRLWGGESDTGCCSVADVDDARRVAQQLGIDHLVFNFTDDFDAHVVEPYVRPTARAHAEPVHRVQPPPQVRPAQRARRPARLRRGRHRPPRPHRRARRRSLRSCTAAPIRRRTRATWCTCCRSANCGARCSRSVTSPRQRSATGPPRSACAPRPSPTARTCASSPRPGGRETFLGARIPFRTGHRGRLPAGTVLGEVDGVEMVTLGQRRGIGLPGGGPKRYVVDIDHATATVVVGDEADLFDDELRVDDVVVGGSADHAARCWCSAAPTAPPCRPTCDGDTSCGGTRRSAAWRRARAWCSTTRPTATCSAAASPADLPGSATGPPARAAPAATARPGRVGRRGTTARAAPCPAALGLASAAQQRRDHRPQADLDGVARGGPGEVGGLGVGQGEVDADDVGSRHHQRLGQHHLVVHDQAGRHQHQPAARQRVEAGSEQPGERRRRRSRRSRR